MTLPPTNDDPDLPLMKPRTLIILLVAGLILAWLGGFGSGYTVANHAINAQSITTIP